MKRDEPITGDGPPGITCACRFKVVGQDEMVNKWAFEDHPCPLEPPAEPRRWYQYTFSFWGALIAIMLCVTVGQIVESVAGCR